MCRSMVDIRSTAAEIRRGKKKKKERNYRAKIYMVSLLGLHRATINYGRPIGQAILFSSCGFFFLFFFFLACSQPTQIECLPYFHKWYDFSANLECMSEMCCTRLAVNIGRKNRQKIAILSNFPALRLPLTRKAIRQLSLLVCATCIPQGGHQVGHRPTC